MNNLNEMMQDRLDKWRKNKTAIPTVKKLNDSVRVNRSGKGDYGDALTEQDWDEEIRKSQTRR